MQHGIDVSEFQEPEVIEKYQPAFVLIRAGYAKETDEYIDRHVKKCEALNIPYGFYWCSYALNKEQAELEAYAFLKAVRPYRPKMGLWLDMEDGDGYKARNGFYFDSSSVSQISYNFCKIVEDAGYYAGIYVSSSWLVYLDASCDRFDRWVANWGNNSGKPEGNFPPGASLWQYTSRYLGDSQDADLCRYNDLSFYDIKPEKKEYTIEERVAILEEKVSILEGFQK